MTFSPDVHVGVAAYVKDGSKVIAVLRGEYVTHGAGEWAFPGGWIDEDEMPQEAVVRELEEETGITRDEVSNVELEWATSNTYPELGTVVCLFYKITLVNGANTPVRNREPAKHEMVIWTEWDALGSTLAPLFPPLADFEAKLSNS